MNIYDIEIAKRIEDIRNDLRKTKIGIDALANIHGKLSELLPDMIPEFIEISKNEEFALSLTNELGSIKPGKQDWTKYEKYCIKVLNYLFIPGFRKVYVQAKTYDGYERRDAIIPNNSNTKFWHDVKNELNAKNIVFEFKNLANSYTKNELNQLRIYLSKPTIGKFGFLFVRDMESNKNLSHAQRDTYGQSGILILIIDDKLLTKLILSRAYLGNCDDVIANEKIKFEINY